MRYLGIAAAAMAIAASATAADTASAQAGAPSAAASGVNTAATSPAHLADYAAEAARGDMYEIQSSKLAESRASSPKVKSFAQQMVRDHTASTNKLTQALSAATPSVEPPQALDARRQALLDQLTAAPAGGFDRLYLQQQMQAHREALALHQGYAKSGDNPKIRTVAAQIAPVVQQHITMLEGMGGS
jgi:putative membrane protein